MFILFHTIWEHWLLVCFFCEYEFLLVIRKLKRSQLSAKEIADSFSRFSSEILFLVVRLQQLLLDSTYIFLFTFNSINRIHNLPISTHCLTFCRQCNILLSSPRVLVCRFQWSRIKYHEIHGRIKDGVGWITKRWIELFELTEALYGIQTQTHLPNPISFSVYTFTQAVPFLMR